MHVFVENLLSLGRVRILYFSSIYSISGLNTKGKKHATFSVNKIRPFSHKMPWS